MNNAVSIYTKGYCVNKKRRGTAHIYLGKMHQSRLLDKKKKQSEM